jgi:two-component system alkaline phosphatase synthesis response regulator PhoP
MSGKEKILIVDDEQDILEFISYNLRKEGFQIETALDGISALKIAPEFRPDLIILDIMMPEMDGVEVCKKLRERPVFQDTLIAFLTARNEDYTQISALENGGMIT